MDLEFLHCFSGHEGPVNQVKFSTDNRYIMSASQDSTVRLWSVENKSLVAKLTGHNGSVNSICSNASDSEIISAGSDGSIVWWDTELQREKRRIKCHSGSINSVCYNYNYSVVVSGSFDSKVEVWDNRVSRPAPVQVLQEAEDSVTSVQAGRYEIFTGGLDEKLRTYDVRNNCLTTDCLGDGIIHIELSDDDQALLISMKKSRIELLTKHNGSVLATYKGATVEKFFVKACFAANKSCVVSGSESGEFIMWDTASSELIKKFSFGEGPILDVAASNPFTSIAVASSNCDIGLFVLK